MRKFWESIYSPNYISGYNPFILKDMNKAIDIWYQQLIIGKKLLFMGYRM